ncbi:class II fructose-bisphosphate aldolase [Spiroplasma endosymbiont of Aspidapion aeneum]|uniref:class II fructose-bisphosphate aldolase n=1 Tax=Spiroplasma endosymbiont of Aspidapion aeneum TaxID=3066276 RepID=UPI00313D11D1
MIKSTKELLLDAKKNKYAIPAFNFDNFEILKGIIEAAEETNSPVIVETIEKMFDHHGFDVLTQMALRMISDAKVPIALHWDHGFNVEPIKRAVRSGFQSVMIDASLKKFAENVKVTKEVVDYAKKYNVNVEGEIGHVHGTDEVEYEANQAYTDVNEAVEFYNKTGVDFLAISVGTKHGKNKGKIEVQIDRIEAIAKALPQAILVLHGTSGTPEDQIKNAIKAGISKINVGQALKVGAYKKMVQFIENSNYEGSWTSMDKEVIDVVKNNAIKVINLLASNGKAKNIK